MLQHQAERADGQQLEVVNGSTHSLSLGQGLKKLLLPRDYDPSRRLFLKKAGEAGLATAAALLLSHPLTEAAEGAAPNSIKTVDWSMVAPQLRAYQALAAKPVSTVEENTTVPTAQHIGVEWFSPEIITNSAANITVFKPNKDGTTHVNTVIAVGFVGSALVPRPEYQGKVYTGLIQRGAEYGYRLDGLFRNDLYLEGTELLEYTNLASPEDLVIGFIKKDAEAYRMYLINYNRKLALSTKYPFRNPQVDPNYASVFVRFEGSYTPLTYSSDRPLATFNGLLINNNQIPNKQSGALTTSNTFGGRYLEGFPYLITLPMQKQVDIYASS